MQIIQIFQKLYTKGRPIIFSLIPKVRLLKNFAIFLLLRYQSNRAPLLVSHTFAYCVLLKCILPANLRMLFCTLRAFYCIPQKFVVFSRFYTWIKLKRLNTFHFFSLQDWLFVPCGTNVRTYNVVFCAIKNGQNELKKRQIMQHTFILYG